MSTIAEQRINDLREIAIVIDTWDDIFSDFDPRPLNERTLSGDFMDELKKRYLETPRGNMQIIIYAPVGLKDEKSEQMVVRRLKTHFKYMALEAKRVIVQVRVRGTIFLCVGFAALAFLTLATYVQFMSPITRAVVEIPLMPLGWFGMWEGFSKLVDAMPRQVEKEDLYDKLSKARYDFRYVEP
jgi:hypothetical protein